MSVSRFEEMREGGIEPGNWFSSKDNYSKSSIEASTSKIVRSSPVRNELPIQLVVVQGNALNSAIPMGTGDASSPPDIVPIAKQPL